MKRRQLMRYAGTSVLTAIGTGLASSLESYQAQASNGVTIQYLGHTSFLFSGSGPRILVNPFRTLGCTAGYRAPKVGTDLVLISSQLLDEGAVEVVPGNPRLLYEPGVYQVSGRKIQGISLEHDLLGGKRFGMDTAWRWTQGGLNILHLGGAAAPITVEQKILLGTPDVLCVPVGGGLKAYSAEQAKQAISVLNPKIIIPMHYRTKAAVKDACDLSPVDTFLSLMSGVPVRRGSNTLALRRSDLPQTGSVIQVMSYPF